MASSPTTSSENRSAGCRSSTPSARFQASPKRDRSPARRASPASIAAAVSTSRGANVSEATSSSACWAAAQRPLRIATHPRMSRWWVARAGPPTAWSRARVSRCSAVESSLRASAIVAPMACGLVGSTRVECADSSSSAASSTVARDPPPSGATDATSAHA